LLRGLDRNAGITLGEALVEPSLCGFARAVDGFVQVDALAGFVAAEVDADKPDVLAAVPAQPEMETERFPLVSIPPFGRGFSRHGGLSIRCGFGKSAKDDFRARLHRLDEPARLSLGMVASPQSPLPFHLAEPL
jgi:hypothetical protein